MEFPNPGGPERKRILQQYFRQYIKQEVLDKGQATVIKTTFDEDDEGKCIISYSLSIFFLFYLVFVILLYMFFNPRLTCRILLISTTIIQENKKQAFLNSFMISQAI